jgi:glycosyltransferase involved in cell wall biosynthesis
MPVHAGADAEHLARALASVAGQTRLPDELLVVEDGPLGERLTAVLDGFAATHPGLLRRVALPVNQGCGAALAVGVREAHGELIARMDSDDVALPVRLEVQLRHQAETGYDLVGGSMLEFEGDEDNVVGVRRLPGAHDDILRYARTRTPVNHPTVLFRRDAVLAAGNYVALGQVEDYDLWARMLARGSRMANVEEPLVLFRCGEGMYARRGGWRHLRSEWELQRRLQDCGLIGPGRRVLNLAVRIGFRLLPAKALRVVYGRLFRRPGAAPA